MIRAALILPATVLAISSSGHAGPFSAYHAAPAYSSGQLKLVQLSDAERVWESIKDTASPAVLNTFIARYKDTKYADMARARLEKIQPREAPQPLSSLTAEASAEEMLAELPIDPEMLRLVESYSLFRNDAPVAVESYEATASQTEVNGGYRTVTTTGERAFVKPVRGNLLRFEILEDYTTAVPQANVTTRYTRQSLEIRAANGLLDLASKMSGVGKSGIEQRMTLIRLRNIEGQLYPLRTGNQFSYEATYRQVDANSPDQLTQRRSCQVVDDQDAARIHPKLAGRFYVMMCRYDTVYKRSKMGASGALRMLFIPQLGIWLHATGDFTLKNFQLR